MLNDGETYTLEDRVYLSPETSRDEQLQFVENLQATQNQGNQDIRTQTRNLGTDIPLNQGGLTGADSYFTQRYQTPQSNALAASLRTAAQATALNQVLNNLQSQYQKQQQDAYKNYQRRASRGSGSSSGSGSGSGSGGGTGGNVTGDVSEQGTNGAITVSDEDITATTNPKAGVSDTTIYRDGQWVTQYSDGTYTVNGKSASSGSDGRTTHEYENPQAANSSAAPIAAAAANAFWGDPLPLIAIGLGNLFGGGN